MSVNLIGQLGAVEYATAVKTLLQQKGSRLRDLVMTGTHRGEQASPVDQIGSVEMQPVTTRFAPMGRVDALFDRRWVFPSSFDLPQLIDNIDKLKLLSDPQSTYVENAVNAAGRQMDRLIVSAATGTAQTGKTGTTATVLPAAQKVAVNFGATGNTNLTVAKLREAKRILMKNEVDLDNDPLTVVLTSSQHDSLLQEAQVISADFNGDRPVLVEGKITRFLGFNFRHTELVENDTTPYRKCVAFAKSGMYLGIWEDVKTDVSERKDLVSLPWQVYLYMTMGATRLEEKKVVQILCNEA